MSTSRSPLNLAAGFRSDVERLLHRFALAESLRYKSFCGVWIELQMSYIFAGREHRPEQREFIEECFFIILDIWSSTEDLQKRVGAYYTMYAIFMKQKYQPMVQIRLTPILWAAMLLFVSDMREQEHLDIEFIFHKLKWCNAFLHVATPKPVYLDHMKGISSEALMIERSLPGNMASTSIVGDLLEADNIEQLSALHEQYHTMKCRLNGPNRTEPSSSLQVIRTDLVQQITKLVTSHEVWLRRKSDQKGRRRRRDANDSSDGGAITTTSESEGDSDGDHIPGGEGSSKKPSVFQKRAEIRERAFNQAVKSDQMKTNRLISRGSESESTSEGSPRKAMHIKEEPGGSKGTQRKRGKARGGNTRASGKTSSGAGEFSSAEDTLDASMDDMPYIAPSVTRKRGRGAASQGRGKLEAISASQPETTESPRRGRQRGRPKTRGGGTSREVAVTAEDGANEGEDFTQLHVVLGTATVKTEHASSSSHDTISVSEIPKISQKVTSGRSRKRSAPSGLASNPNVVGEGNASSPVKRRRGRGRRRGKRC